VCVCVSSVYRTHGLRQYPEAEHNTSDGVKSPLEGNLRSYQFDV
jgi:hypothetical protein